MDESDTFPVALIFPKREGETLGVKYNPNHKWKYLHGMTPDEIVLIKWYVALLVLKETEVLTISYPLVSTRSRMVVSHCSRHTRASATPARLKGPLLDSRLSFVLSFSMINRGFVHL